MAEGDKIIEREDFGEFSKEAGAYPLKVQRMLEMCRLSGHPLVIPKELQIKVKVAKPKPEKKDK